MARQVATRRLASRTSYCSVCKSKVNRTHQWMCGEEWKAVYNWLYSSDPSLVEQGVGRVAAWKARGEVPMMVELTADICGCRLQEMGRVGSGDYQPLLLQYSMVITRFVNGLGDVARLRLNMSADLTTCLHEYGIPSWLVTLRHMGTHKKLPSIASMRSGAEFCLSWLRANYWRPQQLSMASSLLNSQSKTTPTEVGVANCEVGVDISKTVKECWREEQMLSLTSGLCHTRAELEHILEHASDKELADHLEKKQLLQFPACVKYSLSVPSECDLDTLPVLRVGEVEMLVWRRHLLRVGRKSHSFKQRLLSALIMATHQPQCGSGLRDFLCGWLYFLLRSLQEVRTESTTGVGIIQIAEEEELFLPGELNWQQLLQVLTRHPGHYSLPLIKLVAENVKLILSEAALQNILHISRLVTLSSRIGHTSCLYNHTHHEGDYSLQVEEFMASINQVKIAKCAQDSGCGQVNEEDGCGQVNSVGEQWLVVKNVDAWLQCPLGLCPDQKMDVDMFSTILEDRYQMLVEDNAAEKENMEKCVVPLQHSRGRSEADGSPLSPHFNHQQLQHIQQQLLQLL